MISQGRHLGAVSPLKPSSLGNPPRAERLISDRVFEERVLFLQLLHSFTQIPHQRAELHHGKGLHVSDSLTCESGSEVR